MFVQQKLDSFFEATSIAVIGASPKENQVGYIILNKLLEGSFSGNLFAINPKYDKVLGVSCYSTIDEIDQAIELVIIATPANTVHNIIEQCGQKGVKAAVIITAGFSESQNPQLRKKLIASINKYNIRVIGPNCLGIMRPTIGLNATFSNNAATSGNLALISQSGAICTSILDWAIEHNVGFSAVVSMGDAIDVGFGELLDYFALDPNTKSILLYIEGIQNAREFMSGLRACARMKPVIVVKSGRHESGSKAATSHTGAMMGSDEVFDCALQRAGVVRVYTVEQLFSAAHILSAGKKASGNRLLILTNGGGLGVMAADRAAELEVSLPEISDETKEKLNHILPPHWSGNNPVDILGDALPERYSQTVSICKDDSNSDGLLVMLAPQAMTKADKAAQAVAKIATTCDKPLLACWMGHQQVTHGWDAFAKAKIPYFRTPESAVEAFSYLSTYYQNQRLLRQTPKHEILSVKSDIEGARAIINAALTQNRTILSICDAKAILNAFDIPTSQSIKANNKQEALVVAENLGLPVAMKIHSPDVTHKSEVKGILLNLSNVNAIYKGFEKLKENLKKYAPQAHFDGVTIEPMYQRANGRELLIGIASDPIFGPVINFGAGGTMVEVLKDNALGLPPLNRYLVKNLINKTRVYQLLRSFRDKPAIHFKALEDLLLNVSRMVCELPQICEMDINPLIADEQGVIAVDARIVVKKADLDHRYSHLSIPPFPYHLQTQYHLADGTQICIRPIRPEDADQMLRFVATIPEEEKYLRVGSRVEALSLDFMIKLTQIDYDREMGLVATIEQEEDEKFIGICRYISLPDDQSCEFAIVVHDDWQHKGIGKCLISTLR